MNKIFSEYVTSTAFVLQMSKAQVWGLLMVEAQARDLYLYSHCVPMMRGLQSRGLIKHRKKKKHEPMDDYRAWHLTEAGRLVAALCKEAGLTLENCRTVSIIKSYLRVAA